MTPTTVSVENALITQLRETVGAKNPSIEGCGDSSVDLSIRGEAANR